MGGTEAIGSSPWEFLRHHLPLSLLFLLFAGNYFFFFLFSLFSRFEDGEIRKRGASPLLPAFFRQGFAFLLAPLCSLFIRLQIPPNAITLTSLGFSLVAGVLGALGAWEWGGFFYVLSGFGDYLDGRVARATGRVSAKGALLDSFLDRLSDALVLSGILFFYRHNLPGFILALLALWVSFLIPYLRARGEAAGIPMAVGILQRPERVALLSAAFLLSPAVEEYLFAIPAFPYAPMGMTLLLLVLLGSLTIGVRFLRVMRGKEGGNGTA